MDTQEILIAIETIVKKQITDNNIVIESKMQIMGTELRSEMQTMADSAAYRALGMYEERLESLLKVNNECLPDLIETIKNHGKRIDQLEQTVPLFGVAIKSNSATIKTHHDEIKKIKTKIFA